MLLSIVIPVYNVEEYISKCLGSIFEEECSLHFFEVIIVNDGTKDNSMVVVNRFASLYDNIVVVNQENRGLSEARNTGLSRARGEYIWFVDSDDYIEQGSLASILSIIDQQSSDVLICDGTLFSEGHTINTETSLTPGVEVSGQYFFCSNRTYSVWRYLFRREFLLLFNLKFRSGIYHEDGDFLTRLFAYANTVVYLPLKIYNYDAGRVGSIMNTISFKRVCTGIDFIVFFNNFLRENHFSLAFSRSVCCDRINTLLDYFIPLLDRMVIDDKIRFKQEILRNKWEIISCLYMSGRWKYILLIPFLYINSSLFLYIILFRKHKLLEIKSV